MFDATFDATALRELTELVARRAAGCEPGGLYAVGLDPRGQPCGVAANPRHRALAWVKVWELRALADELGAAALVLVLVGSGPPREPSAHELAAFVDLVLRAQRARLVVVDCVVTRGGPWWSLRRCVAEGRSRAIPTR